MIVVVIIPVEFQPPFQEFFFLERHSWQLLSSGHGPLRSLTEQVNVSRRASASDPWEVYFENKFDLCAPNAHPSLCAGALMPGSVFSYIDHHQPSHSPFSPHFRAIEHYFVNGVFGGCVTVVYDQVDGAMGAGE